MKIVLELLCGLVLFLYGMELMGDALKKSAGSSLKTILGKRTEGIVKKQSGDTLYVEVVNGEKKGQEIKYSLSACIRGKLIVVLE